MMPWDDTHPLVQGEWLVGGQQHGEAVQHVAMTW
jgi:hypothetical protein